MMQVQVSHGNDVRPALPLPALQDCHLPQVEKAEEDVHGDVWNSMI